VRRDWRIKKPSYQFTIPGQPGCLLILEEIRGFPSPPHGGFGFLIYVEAFIKGLASYVKPFFKLLRFFSQKLAEKDNSFIHKLGTAVCGPPGGWRRRRPGAPGPPPHRVINLIVREFYKP
jgi:hypothetical protein